MGKGNLGTGIRECRNCGVEFETFGRAYTTCAECGGRKGKRYYRLKSDPVEPPGLIGPRPCIVYVVTMDYPGDEFICKIGHTITTTRHRMKGLQTGNPWELEVTAQFYDPLGHLEYYLHRCFKNNRMMGEWFNLDNEGLPLIISRVEEYSKQQKVNAYLMPIAA